MSSDLLSRARALHRQAPLVDGHNDLAWVFRQRVPSLDVDALDLRTAQPAFMTDIPRLRAGGVGAQFWAAYVPGALQGQTAVRMALEQIDLIHRLVAKYPEHLSLARTAADVERIAAAGRIASLIAVEGGQAIDESLGVLRMLFALGARYLTLTHNDNVPWADSATDDPAAGGLTSFGRDVVREMNRLGMMVDLSHVSPDTMRDALDVSRAPVIFSHASARALCDVPRNVPDDVLRRLTANGGVAMVTFVPVFLAPAAAARYARIDEERRRLSGEHPLDRAAVRARLDAFIAQDPEPRATLAMAADHIDHVRRVAGIDHVGIGGDFDGITSTPDGLTDVAAYPALTAELLRRGYSDEELLKLLGRNILRVMRDVERAADPARAIEEARG